MSGIADETAVGTSLPVLSKDTLGFLQQPVSLNQEPVPVPEWGCTVILRELTAEEKQQYEASIVSWGKDGKPKVNAQDAALKLIVRSAIDGNHVQVFTLADIPNLRRQPGAVIDRLFRVAKRLSAVDEEELERLKNA
jgi:hypothetical protein